MSLILSCSEKKEGIFSQAFIVCMWGKGGSAVVKPLFLQKQLCTDAKNRSTIAKNVEAV